MENKIFYVDPFENPRLMIWLRAMNKIYTHGGDIYRENVINKIKYDFSINVNPLGMPASVVEAAKRGVELSDRYPDHMGEKLCGRLSEKLGCRPESILMGNGAAELIYALCAAQMPVRAYIPAPGFSEYEAAVKAFSGEIVYIGTDNAFADKSYPVQIISALKAHNPDEGSAILFICNPNNPTGYCFDRKTLLEMAEVCDERNIRLVVDECFIEFTDRENECSLVHELENFKQLVVLRAFTKIYAMPGLRLGYMLTADMAFKDRVNSFLQPWNTSIPAQMAGCAALDEEGYLEETVICVKREREYLEKELSGFRKIHMYPSEANFIMFSIEEDAVCGEGSLYDSLLGCGILIRRCDDYRGLAYAEHTSYYRIAVKNHDENTELIRAVKEVLNG
jgi:threonine-phosphate decarboxylase